MQSLRLAWGILWRMTRWGLLLGAMSKSDYRSTIIDSAVLR